MANNQQNLFSALRRLFSTDVIIRNDGGNMLSVMDPDNIQSNGVIQTNSLIDRFHKVYTTSTAYGVNLNLAQNYQSARVQIYADYDAMDTDAIIASALDIIADECLGADTVIPLLDGTKKTIKELYDSGAKDIWIYGLDEKTNEFRPVKAEKVAYNGKKRVYKITFDDGTEVKATSNHIWIDSGGSQITTSDIKIGTSILALSTKISEGTSMPGYEKIWSGDKFEYTHRIVANQVPFLKEQRNQIPAKEKPVVHHDSFDKRNNNPNFLKWVGWNEHNKIHAEYNKNLWVSINSDPSKKNDYYVKLMEGQKHFWENVDKQSFLKKKSDSMKSYMENLSSEERKIVYGHRGSKNGMYGKGYKISKEKNGRYNTQTTRKKSINLAYIIDRIKNDPHKNILGDIQKELNIITFEWRKIIRDLFAVYKCNNTKTLINKILSNHSADTIIKFRSYCNNTYKEGKRFLVSDFCNSNSITINKLRRIVLGNGYSTLEDFAKSSNHKVVSIEECGYEDVYDIVNAGDNHIFAIEAKDGSKIYTHNCTLKNEQGQVLTIRSSDETIQKLLENLFYSVLNIEFNLWSWIRNMCKYGDFYLKMEISEKYGVYNVIPFSAYNIVRQEGYNPHNPNEVRFKFDPNAALSATSGYTSAFNNQDPGVWFDNYEMAHFRLIGDVNYLPYGRSYLEPARKLFKQYTLIEDAMLIHRITRAPERRVFYVNVGAIPPNEVENYVQKMINKMKKTPLIDPNTGQYNLKYNQQNLLEDFFIPVRGNDSTTRIDTAKGLEYNGIDDVAYFREKLFAALKIPKAFMGYEKDLTGKATLAAEDIRFARTIERIQRIIASELKKIALVHLYANGYTDDSMANFSLSLTNPSIIYDQERIALFKEKIDLANQSIEGNILPREYVWENIFHMSPDSFGELEDMIVEDQKRKFRYDQITTEGNDPLESGQAYGTPHQIAGLYGGQKVLNVPTGYNETNPNEPVKLPGRPRKYKSTFGTDSSAFGRDGIGRYGMKSNAETGEDSLKPKYKGGPMSFESTMAVYLKNKESLEKMFPGKKVSLFEEKSEESSLLDERNIKED